MAESNGLPLYQKVGVERPLKRFLDVVIFFLHVSLLCYRLLLFRRHGFSSLFAIAFLCELWFTFYWALITNLNWSPIHYITYPQRLLQRVSEVPPVDVFVTTADPELEPPIILINTVLSVLAVEYPANKLACYVSDDGCSSLTFYSLCEALKFAQIWVPFCKKYKVQIRAPFRYFSGDLDSHGSTEFQYEWRRMKDEYEELRRRIEVAAAAKNSAFSNLIGEFPDFANSKPNNHPPIVKVIWENKEGLWDGVPHLVYVSREKKPQIPHHYKAGAMNVLTRVSGLMTNAPYMLNLDCDMFVNNPEVILQAMCLLLDPKIDKIDKEFAFVQFPQCFYNGLKDDPAGNQAIVVMQLAFRGMAGVQGSFYIGTGCIHRRKVMYGQSPDEANINEKYDEVELYKTFGNSKEFVTSATRTLRSFADDPNCLSNSIEATNEVATADYEHNSCWGFKVGWQYGSVVEDMLTGMGIHKKGWKSAYITPNPPAFLGCAPMGGPVPLGHMKRVMTGLLETLISRESPIVTALCDKLQFRQRLIYLWGYLVSIRAIPDICYATLPAFCLISNSHFLPKVQEPVLFIPLLLFVINNLRQLLDFFETGQSVRAWWNGQTMERILVMSSSLPGMVTVILKILGLSETVFEITKKESSSSSDDKESTDRDLGRFTFDESPIFVPVTTILMIQLAALLISFLGTQTSVQEFGVAEVMSCVWLILCFWSFLKGMFAKGSYGLPWPTLLKSSALTFLFVYFCQVK
ncbi:cellulose synthase-like protein H1 isoform X1 [Cucurbita moschata]|uniref:Cellulose synthase-like protein H1 isoform X1 n=1 Tax=Cucurbita moschata TaxID=3662 RepID=A0A6J1FXB7_CUCMO|nr:cellulose synthase-like protein H1 isoform X1 [Cucurbita moschata]